MLVHNPKTLAVYSDDEAGAHLTERLEVGDLIGPRQGCRGITVWPGQVPHPVGRWPRLLRRGRHSADKRGAVFESQARFDRLESRRGKLEAAFRAGRGAVFPAVARPN